MQNIVERINKRDLRRQCRRRSSTVFAECAASGKRRVARRDRESPLALRLVVGECGDGGDTLSSGLSRALLEYADAHSPLAHSSPNRPAGRVECAPTGEKHGGRRLTVGEKRRGAAPFATALSATVAARAGGSDRLSAASRRSPSIVVVVVVVDAAAAAAAMSTDGGRQGARERDASARARALHEW